MSTRDHLRPSRAAWLAAALAAATIAGCSGPEATAAPAPASSPAAAAPSPTELPPADAVKTGLQRLAASAHTYTVAGTYWDKQKYRASGTYDPKAHKDSRTSVISGGDKPKTRKIIVIAGKSYVQATGMQGWRRADLSRLTPASDYWVADPKDPGGLTRFIAAIHSARRIGPNKYEGEANLDDKSGALTYLPLGAPVLRFGGGGSLVSYQVTTTVKGDVTSIRTVFDTVEGTMDHTTTYGNLGRPVKITAPSPVVDVPSSAYSAR
ncbi:hypothetical protein ACFY36_04100 [Actinoplanes sp. NPDC000266]